MNVRKFKVTCQQKDVGGGSIASIRDCKEELIVEIEDNPNCEQEAANALVKKLGDHLKQQHPKY